GDDVEGVDLRTRAEDSGLVFRDPSSLTAGSYQSQLDREVLMGLFCDTSTTHLGIRAPEEIVDRLLRKVWEAADPESFWAAVQVLVQLGDLTGDPREVLESAGNLLASVGVESRVVAEITETFDTLTAAAFPFDRTRLDFSFARGITYYTGLVFEVDVHGADGPITVGGGGRYDDLVRALGGQRDVPALGFAFTVEPMLAASKSATSAVTARDSET
ncbi:ATP phosphoribosyltransferase regulatory subunit, partial [Dehalococcoidia bacterium]|nr:ATP phosphoribosyltransferase regulatory subunit [Dehalococcoidia bacterium]